MRWRIAGALTGDLWTARLLRDAPEEIAGVHRAYFAAGARVATTASYQASIQGFARLGLSRADAEALIGHSVLLARKVRDEARGGWGRAGRRGFCRPVRCRAGRRVGISGAVWRHCCSPSRRYALGWNCWHPPVRIWLPWRRSLMWTRPRSWSSCWTRIGLPAWFSYSAERLKTGAGPAA